MVRICSAACIAAVALSVLLTCTFAPVASSWSLPGARSFRLPFSKTVSLDGVKRYPRPPNIPHDTITYRRRGPRGDVVSHVPQAERYKSTDWLHIMLTLPTSAVLKRIWKVILANVLWSVVVVLVGRRFSLPPLPSRGHTLLGGSLGLLLVFRTNSSYARFWEGRCVWEKLHNRIRDMARMLVAYDQFVGRKRVLAVGRLLTAFPFVLHEHLTGISHKKELIPVLGEDLAADLALAWNGPLFICNRMTKSLRALPTSKDFTDRERLALVSMVNDLGACIGACERIVQTPVPLHYARHTSRFLTLWLGSLPFVMIEELRWGIVAVMGFLTWSLFGIQEIGLLIEEPFQEILKLDVIAEVISRDVQETLQHDEDEEEDPFDDNPLEDATQHTHIHTHPAPSHTDIHAHSAPSNTDTPRSSSSSASASVSGHALSSTVSASAPSTDDGGIRGEVGVGEVLVHSNTSTGKLPKTIVTA